MVEDISALGLRHVGYAIPTEIFCRDFMSCLEELFAPFVSCFVETEPRRSESFMSFGEKEYGAEVKELTSDAAGHRCIRVLWKQEVTCSAFRWSLTLISKTLRSECSPSEAVNVQKLFRYVSIRLKSFMWSPVRHRAC